MSDHFLESFNFLFNCYDNDYVFDGPRDRPPTKPENVHSDVKVYPQNHMRAYYQLASFSDQVSDFAIPSFQWFSLVTSLSPGYIMIDTKKLCMDILDMTNAQFNALTVRRPRNKMCQWGRAVNLNEKCFFKRERQDSTLMFRGTIYTDGVRISILKIDQDTTAEGTGGQRITRPRELRLGEEFPYKTDPASRRALQNDCNCIVIDPP
jgi:hypothetical protein